MDFFGFREYLYVQVGIHPDVRSMVNSISDIFQIQKLGG
jgi:hypothetical protein